MFSPYCRTVIYKNGWMTGGAKFNSCVHDKEEKCVRINFLASEELVRFILLQNKGLVRVNIRTVPIYYGEGEKEEKLSQQSIIEYSYRG